MQYTSGFVRTRAEEVVKLVPRREVNETSLKKEIQDGYSSRTSLAAHRG